MSSLRLIMISSSNFFNKTLFQTEEKAKNTLQLFDLPKKDILTPWCPHEDSGLDLIRKSQLSDLKKQREKSGLERRQKSMKLSSNLFPAKVSLKLPPINSNSILTSNQTPSLQVSPKNTLRGSVVIKRENDQRKKRSESNYDQVSINEFLNRQRTILYSEKQSNKKPSKPATEDLEPVNFFMHRHLKRWGSKEYQSKTLDLRKQLIEPMELYNRKSVVAINPELKKSRLGARMSRDKYRPLHNNRYYL